MSTSFISSKKSINKEKVKKKKVRSRIRLKGSRRGKVKNQSKDLSKYFLMINRLIIIFKFYNVHLIY